MLFFLFLILYIQTDKKTVKKSKNSIILQNEYLYKKLYFLEICLFICISIVYRNVSRENYSSS